MTQTSVGTAAVPSAGSPPKVVATIHDRESLTAALRLRPGSVDLLELRLDGFPEATDWLFEKSAGLKLPLIITARDPREGAIHPMNLSARQKLYQQFFGRAAALDMEVRSASQLADTRLLAKALGVRLILSFHDFKSTPSLPVLRSLARRAAAAGADIFKVATTLRTPGHLATLHSLVAHPPVPCAISAMGMGPMGKISRLLLAQAGSVLNYGYLTKAQVPGQWPATLLRKQLDELLKP